MFLSYPVTHHRLVTIYLIKLYNVKMWRWKFPAKEITIPIKIHSNVEDFFRDLQSSTTRKDCIYLTFHRHCVVSETAFWRLYHVLSNSKIHLHPYHFTMWLKTFLVFSFFKNQTNIKATTRMYKYILKPQRKEGLEKFYQHVVLAYAENIFVMFKYIWPPESKSEWCKCVNVERSEIWVKKCSFWSKNMFLACFKAFTLFSLSMRIDNNFLITISGDSTTYLW